MIGVPSERIVDIMSPPSLRYVSIAALGQIGHCEAPCRDTRVGIPADHVAVKRLSGSGAAHHHVVPNKFPLSLVGLGSVLPLAEAVVAHEMLEGERRYKRGKIVLRVDDEDG